MYKKIMLLCMVLILLVGCSKAKDVVNKTSEKTPVDESPVHLKMIIHLATFSDELVQKLIVEPVQKKYPYISLEVLRTDGKDITFEKLVAANEIPDIIYSTNAAFFDFKRLDLPLDLNDLVKKFKMDTTRFQTVLMDTILMFGKEGQLYSLPLSSNFSATFYNKKLFDKFGVPYPKDGMTWDDTIELGKRMTREDGSISYHGFDPGPPGKLAKQYSPKWYDPQTGKSTYMDPVFQQFLTLYKRVKDSGNTADPPNRVSTSSSIGRDAFQKDQTLAMLLDVGSRIDSIQASNNLDWNLVTSPTLKERPNVGLNVDIHTLSITKTSAHKDAAFKLISTITDNDTQLKFAQQARVSSLKDPKMIQAFATAIPELKDKNFAPALSMQPSLIYVDDEFSQISSGKIDSAVKKVIENNKDINTALRETYDEVNLLIDQAKNK